LRLRLRLMKRRKVEVEVKVEEKKEEIAQHNGLLYMYKPRLSRGAAGHLRSLLPHASQPRRFFYYMDFFYFLFVFLVCFVDRG
jgi:hypothetical protein